MNIAHQTRDHFHAGAVLKGLREKTIPPEELPRLLEECCHALTRSREDYSNLHKGVHSALYPNK